MTPSNRSGALPRTTASMSAQPRPASSSARWAASRSSPAMDTSSRLVWYAVWPMPMIAQGLPMGLSRKDADQVLLQARTGGRVTEGPGGGAVEDARGRLTDADQPGGHHRVGRQGPAGRVDQDLVAQAECL